MLHTLSKVSTCVCAVLITIASTHTPLSADLILDTNTFESSEPSGGGFIAATTQIFVLTSADIPNVTFDANFDIIDAGIEILVNGTSLFNTGDDLSNFGPQVFTPTAVQPNNIDFSFASNNNGLPRLIVESDSTGTTLSGSPFQNSTSTFEYLPIFSVQNFSSLLQVGDNQIEIVNLNSFQGANLDGDYTVTLVTPPTAFPEPSSLSLCLAGAMLCLGRRRRR